MENIQTQEHENINDSDVIRHEKMGPDPVPFIVHEAEMYRLDRINKRLWITVLVTLTALAVSNTIWIVRFLGG